MTNKALLIGNGTFAEGSGLRTLNGPAHDVIRMQEALTHPAYGLFAAADVIVCKEQDRVALEGSIGTFLEATSRDDYVLVYYSGHGIKGGDRLYLAARDTVKAKVWTGVSTALIRDLLNDTARAERVAFVLDCCYAGGAFDKGGDDDAALLTAAFSGHWFLCSSTATETSKDGEEGSPSPFTAALTAALVDPSLSSGDSGELTLDVVYKSMLATLNPSPVLNQTAQGLAPIARRTPVGGSDAAQVFEELTRLCDADVEILRTVDASAADMAAARHLTALLDLVSRPAGSGRKSSHASSAIDAAWSFVSESLRQHGLDEALLKEMGERNSPTCLQRLCLKFLDDDVAQLPWEYLEHDVPGRPRGPLALRRNVIIERRTTMASPMLPPAEDRITEVALIGVHAGDVPADAEAALRGDLERIGVQALPPEPGKRLTYSNVSLCNELPPVLVLLAALRRTSTAGAEAKVELQLGGAVRGDEWIDAAFFVDALMSLALNRDVAPYRAIVIEAFAIEPALDAPGATAQLSLDLARLGIGNVVFLCHPPEFVNYPTPQGGQLRTFVGYLIAALNKGFSFSRAVYAARSRMQTTFVDHCERSFGVPGVYVPDFAPGDHEPVSEPASAQTSAVSATNRRLTQDERTGGQPDDQRTGGRRADGFLGSSRNRGPDLHPRPIDRDRDPNEAPSPDPALDAAVPEPNIYPSPPDGRGSS